MPGAVATLKMSFHVLNAETCTLQDYYNYMGEYSPESMVHFHVKPSLFKRSPKSLAKEIYSLCASNWSGVDWSECLNNVSVNTASDPVVLFAGYIENPGRFPIPLDIVFIITENPVYSRGLFIPLVPKIPFQEGSSVQPTVRTYFLKEILTSKICMFYEDVPTFDFSDITPENFLSARSIVNFIPIVEIPTQVHIVDVIYYYFKIHKKKRYGCYPLEASRYILWTKDEELYFPSPFFVEHSELLVTGLTRWEQNRMTVPFSRKEIELVDILFNQCGGGEICFPRINCSIETVYNLVDYFCLVMGKSSLKVRGYHFKPSELLGLKLVAEGVILHGTLQTTWFGKMTSADRRARNKAIWQLTWTEKKYYAIPEETLPKVTIVRNVEKQILEQPLLDSLSALKEALTPSISIKFPEEMIKMMESVSRTSETITATTARTYDTLTDFFRSCGISGEEDTLLKTVLTNLTSHMAGVLATVAQLWRSRDLSDYVLGLTQLLSLLGLEQTLIDNIVGVVSTISHKMQPRREARLEQQMLGGLTKESFLNQFNNFSSVMEGVDLSAFGKKAVPIAAIVMTLSQILGINLPGLDMAKHGVRFGKNFKDLTKGLESIEDLADELGFGFSERTKFVTELKEDVHTMIKAMIDIESQLAVKSAVYCDDEEFEYVRSLKTKIEKIRKNLSTHKYDKFIGTTMHQEVQQISRKFDTIWHKIVDLRAKAGIRPTPVGVVFMGQTGIGKSHWSAIFHERLAAYCYKLYRDEEKRIQQQIEQDYPMVPPNKYLMFADACHWQVWNEQNRDKYDTGYEGQEIHYCDDGFMDSLDEDHSKLIAFISNAQVGTVQADLLDKGKAYQARIVHINCNKFPKTSQRITNIEALHNRFKNFYYVSSEFLGGDQPSVPSDCPLFFYRTTATDACAPKIHRDTNVNIVTDLIADKYVIRNDLCTTLDGVVQQVAHDMACNFNTYKARQELMRESRREMMAQANERALICSSYPAEMYETLADDVETQVYQPLDKSIFYVQSNEEERPNPDVTFARYLRFTAEAMEKLSLEGSPVYSEVCTHYPEYDDFEVLLICLAKGYFRPLKPEVYNVQFQQFLTGQYCLYDKGLPRNIIRCDAQAITIYSLSQRKVFRLFKKTEFIAAHEASIEAMRRHFHFTYENDFPFMKRWASMVMDGVNRILLWFAELFDWDMTRWISYSALFSAIVSPIILFVLVMCIVIFLFKLMERMFGCKCPTDRLLKQWEAEHFNRCRFYAPCTERCLEKGELFIKAILSNAYLDNCTYPCCKHHQVCEKESHVDCWFVGPSAKIFTTWCDTIKLPQFESIIRALALRQPKPGPLPMMAGSSTFTVQEMRQGNILHRKPREFLLKPEDSLKTYTRVPKRGVRVKEDSLKTYVPTKRTKVKVREAGVIVPPLCQVTGKSQLELSSNFEDTRLVVVTGFPFSGCGKGVVSCGFINAMSQFGKVVAIKVDSYLSTTQSHRPSDHGEIFVLEDGNEVDLDLGRYQRAGASEVINFRDEDLQRYRQIKQKSETAVTDELVAEFIVADILEKVKTADARLVIELGGCIDDSTLNPYLIAVRYLMRYLPSKVVGVSRVEKVFGINRTRNLKRAVEQIQSKLGWPCSALFCHQETDVQEVCKVPVINLPTDAFYLWKVITRIGRECGLDMEDHQYPTERKQVKILTKYYTEEAHASLIDVIYMLGLKYGFNPEIVIDKTVSAQDDIVVAAGGFGKIDSEVLREEICRMVIPECETPFLGICFGHQLAFSGVFDVRHPEIDGQSVMRNGYRIGNRHSRTRKGLFDGKIWRNQYFVLNSKSEEINMYQWTSNALTVQWHPEMHPEIRFQNLESIPSEFTFLIERIFQEGRAVRRQPRRVYEKKGCLSESQESPHIEEVESEEVLENSQNEKNKCESESQENPHVRDLIDPDIKKVEVSEPTWSLDDLQLRNPFFGKTTSAEDLERKKPGSVPTIHWEKRAVEPEVAVDPQSLNILSSFCQKNLVSVRVLSKYGRLQQEVTFVGKDGHSFYGWARAHKVITVGHGAELGQYATMEHIPFCSGSKKEGTFGLKCVKIDTERDLACWEQILPSELAKIGVRCDYPISFPEFIHYVPQSNKYVHAVSTFAGSQFVGLMGCHSSVQLKYAGRVLEDDGTLLGTSDFEVAALAMNTVTRAGDCGSPLFINNPSASGKLVGLHHLGARDCSVTYSICVTQQIILDLCGTPLEPQNLQEPQVEGLVPIYTACKPRIKVNTEFGVGEYFVSFVKEPMYLGDSMSQFIGNLYDPVRDRILCAPPTAYNFDRVGENPVLNKRRVNQPTPFLKCFEMHKVPVVLTLSDPRVMEVEHLPKDGYGNRNLLLAETDKYRFDEGSVDVEDLNDMVNQLIDYSCSVFDGRDIGECTFAQALCGDKAVSPNFIPMNLKSSNGLPWTLFGLNSGSDLFMVNENEPGSYRSLNKYAKRCEQMVEEKIRYANQGLRVTSLWKNCLKDELRPLAKVVRPKTRMFTAAPRETTIAFRRLFGKYKACWTDERFKLFHMVGINPHSFEWTKLANSLQTFPYLLDEDFEAFDKRELATFMWAVGAIIIETIDRISKDGLKEARKVLWAEIIHTFCVSYTDVFVKFGGNPSGNPMTTVLNSWINLLYHWYCFRKATGMKSLADFQRCVRLYSFGDDVVQSISEEVIEKYNFQTIRQYMAEIGQVVTPGDKMAVADGFKYKIGLENLTFLKRGFKRSIKRPGFYFAPLDVESIESLYSWTSIPEGDYLTWSNTVHESLLEASLHGRVYFDKFRMTLYHYICTGGFQKRHPSLFWGMRPHLIRQYDDICEEYYDRYFEATLSNVVLHKENLVSICPALSRDYLQLQSIVPAKIQSDQFSLAFKMSVIPNANSSADTVDAKEGVTPVEHVRGIRMNNQTLASKDVFAKAHEFYPVTTAEVTTKTTARTKVFDLSSGALLTSYMKWLNDAHHYCHGNIEVKIIVTSNAGLSGQLLFGVHPSDFTNYTDEEFGDNDRRIVDISVREAYCFTLAPVADATAPATYVYGMIPCDKTSAYFPHLACVAYSDILSTFANDALKAQIQIYARYAPGFRFICRGPIRTAVTPSIDYENPINVPFSVITQDDNAQLFTDGTLAHDYTMDNPIKDRTQHTVIDAAEVVASAKTGEPVNGYTMDTPKSLLAQWLHGSEHYEAKLDVAVSNPGLIKFYVEDDYSPGANDDGWDKTRTHFDVSLAQTTFDSIDLTRDIPREVYTVGAIKITYFHWLPKKTNTIDTDPAALGPGEGTYSFQNPDSDPFTEVIYATTTAMMNRAPCADAADDFHVSELRTYTAEPYPCDTIELCQDGYIGKFHALDQCEGYRFTPLGSTAQWNQNRSGEVIQNGMVGVWMTVSTLSFYAENDALITATSLKGLNDERLYELPDGCYALGCTSRPVPSVTQEAASAHYPTILPSFSLAQRLATLYDPGKTWLLELKDRKFKQLVGTIIFSGPTSTVFMKTASGLEFAVSKYKAGELYIANAKVVEEGTTFPTATTQGWLSRTTDSYAQSITPTKRQTVLRKGAFTRQSMAGSIAGGALSGLGDGLSRYFDYMFQQQMFDRNSNLAIQLRKMIGEQQFQQLQYQMQMQNQITQEQIAGNQKLQKITDFDKANYAGITTPAKMLENARDGEKEADAAAPVANAAIPSVMNTADGGADTGLTPAFAAYLASQKSDPAQRTDKAMIHAFKAPNLLSDATPQDPIEAHNAWMARLAAVQSQSQPVTSTASPERAQLGRTAPLEQNAAALEKAISAPESLPPPLRPFTVAMKNAMDPAEMMALIKDRDDLDPTPDPLEALQHSDELKPIAFQGDPNEDPMTAMRALANRDDLDVEPTANMARPKPYISEPLSKAYVPFKGIKSVYVPESRADVVMRRNPNVLNPNHPDFGQTDLTQLTHEDPRPVSGWSIPISGKRFKGAENWLTL